MRLQPETLLASSSAEMSPWHSSLIPPRGFPQHRARSVGGACGLEACTAAGQNAQALKPQSLLSLAQPQPNVSVALVLALHLPPVAPQAARSLIHDLHHQEHVPARQSSAGMLWLVRV